MPMRLPARRAWIQLAALLVLLPGPMQQAADPALAELKRGDAFYNEAMKHFEAKNWTLGNEARAKGIASYQKAIQLNPRLFEAHRRLADLSRRNTTLPGNLQIAAESYKKALEIKPDAETASRLGITYIELGRTAEAIAPFELAARLDPKVAMFQYNLGFAHAELANLDAARKVLARLRTMDSTLARKLREKIGKTSGESSLTGRPATYSNPKIELVAISPGGTITQGFYIGKYPVTQVQWQTVMGDNPSFFKSCGENCPVEQVSWNDAQAFIARVNQLNDGFRYRLPSEVEWEYGYRAGTTTPDYAPGDIGWHSRNSGNKTHPVGEKPANPFGLYDMSGHVKEWCQDTGEEPLYRVLRGSSFYGMPTSGATARSKGRVDEVSRNNGFRVVAEKQG